MLLVEAETKISNVKDDHERKVGNLLLNLGLRLVDYDSIIHNQKNERIGEIDLIFIFNETIFLVEVSKEKKSGNKKIAFFSKWSDVNNLKIMKEKYKLGPKKVLRIYFDLSQNTPEIVSAEIKNMATKGYSLPLDDNHYYTWKEITEILSGR